VLQKEKSRHNTICICITRSFTQSMRKAQARYTTPFSSLVFSLFSRTEVGARSWLNSGDGMSMFAKCAACPASCIKVVRAVKPDPTMLGSARDVKWATDGCQVPSDLRHAAMEEEDEVAEHRKCKHRDWKRERCKNSVRSK